jgi:hypothetical protein
MTVHQADLRDPRVDPSPKDRVEVDQGDRGIIVFTVLAVGRTNHGLGLDCVFVDREIVRDGDVIDRASFDEVLLPDWQALVAGGRVIS